MSYAAQQVGTACISSVSVSRGFLVVPQAHNDGTWLLLAGKVAITAADRVGLLLITREICWHRFGVSRLLRIGRASSPWGTAGNGSLSSLTLTPSGPAP